MAFSLELSGLSQYLTTPELQDPFFAGGRVAERNGAVLTEHDYLFTELERSGLAARQVLSGLNIPDVANLKQDMTENDLLGIGDWCQS